MIADKEEGLSGNIFMSESISSCFISADNLLYEIVFESFYIFFWIGSQRLSTT